MEVMGTPPAATANRVRSSSKAVPKSASVARKKTASPRKSKPAASSLPVPEVLTAMISTAAYYRAASRGFAPGQELQDWLDAERQILGQYC